MSKYRTELVPAAADDNVVRDVTAYLLILRAVEQQPGLIHGRLHHHGASCAIGSFFDLHGGKLALETNLIDEVAAVNDGAPALSARARKQHVREWLRWKLGTLGWVPRPRQARSPKPDAAAMTMIARQVEAAAREGTD